MADLAAANVTITVEERWQTQRKRHSRVKITFGDGALTYPANGVPLPTYSSFGLYRVLDFITLIDNNDGVGLVWKYDKENKKLRAWQVAAGTHGHDFLVKGGQAAAGTDALSIKGAVVIGKEAATDVTQTEAGAAAGGGVITKTIAAAAPVELGNVAVAAQTLYAEAIGW